jgi:hypothetical protein
MQAVPGALLLAIGLTGPLASVQWRRGHWLGLGRWMVQRVSPHAVVGLPVTGTFVMAVGASLLWPPAIVAAFVLGVAALFTMRRSSVSGWLRRVPPALRPDHELRPRRTVRKTPRTVPERSERTAPRGSTLRAAAASRMAHQRSQMVERRRRLTAAAAPEDEREARRTG